jgi:peroxiredoxin
MALLRDRASEFEEAGARRFGISRDSPWSHVAWHQALDLDFHLLSDWEGEATRAFGVAHEFRGLSDISRRSAFVIGSDARVAATWEYEPAELPDVDEVLSALREL